MDREIGGKEIRWGRVLGAGWSVPGETGGLRWGQGVRVLAAHSLFGDREFSCRVCEYVKVYECKNTCICSCVSLRVCVQECRSMRVSRCV